MVGLESEMWWACAEAEAEVNEVTEAHRLIGVAASETSTKEAARRIGWRRRCWPR